MKNSKTWISQVIQMLGPHKTSTEIPDKIAYSRDMWPKALLWQRKGDYPFHPDLVVWPENEDEVCKILEFCHSHEIPIVPWGGGSGVCGGAIPVRGGLVMDLKRMNKILHIDRKSLLVRSQTGIMGEILERSLNQEGLTLGHFPSSIYCSTLGGWLATRAAGQLSSLYGKIEDMVSSLRIALPSGRILETPSGPKSSTGPDFNQLFLGTEGTLGIFTQAELKVHPLPEHRAFLSGTFSNLENGLEGIRLLMQNGLRPAALRLYDGLDTLLAFQKKGKKKKKKKPLSSHQALMERFREFLKIKGYRFILEHPSFLKQLSQIVARKSLLICIFEGIKALNQVQLELAKKILNPFGFHEVPGMAEEWWNQRYSVSYKQSPIFDLGGFVDTMEIAAPWSKLMSLYERISHQISQKALVMAHFSHAYTTGNSIYFTFAAYHKDLETLQNIYDSIWKESLEICLEMGGAISHHHGIGLSKTSYLKRFWGEELWEVYLDLQRKLDPKAILNPGKMGKI